MNLTVTNLYKASLSNADLRSTGLYGANLRGADLSGLDLRDTDLSDADLRSTGLYGADLRGADLSGADLHGNIGSSEGIMGAIAETDAKTLFGPLPPEQLCVIIIVLNTSTTFRAARPSVRYCAQLGISH